MRVRAWVAAALCSAVWSGCGSSPGSTFFALAPATGVPQPCRLRAIEIRRPGLAGYLDRPEIVKRVVDFRLGIAGTDRWGEPLDAMVARVLAQDVEQRLPESTVFTEEGAITADPDATVEVDVRRFDVDDTGEVVLQAEVALEVGASHAATTSRGLTLREKPHGPTTPALVGAMSDLLGRLADRIAALVSKAS
jgi:uncharacterized lipoprotein YmbA